MKASGFFVTGMSWAVAAAAVLSASAETCTWVGGASGSFYETANWSPAALPATGDTLVFTESVTFAEASSDIVIDAGTKGFTIDVAADKTVNGAVSYTGSGKIIKRGAGKLTCEKPWKTTGGLRIEAGSVFVDQLPEPYHNRQDPFGTGPIEITGTGLFDNTSYVRHFTTPFSVTEFTGTSAFNNGGPVVYDGAITSDSDFTFTATWAYASFASGIRAPGRTVTMELKGGSDQTGQWKGTFDAASFVKTGGQNVSFLGSVTNPNCSFTLQGGKMTIDASAKWYAGSVTVDGGNTSLVLPSGKTLPTAITVVNSGKISTSERVTVRALIVNGSPVAEGDHTATDLPDVISSGTVTVDGRIHVWAGGSTNAWAEASNWLPAEIPPSGSYCLFGQSVSFTDATIDIGEKGMTFDTASDLKGKVLYAGSGRLIKRGAGQLTAENAPWPLTGGIQVEEGILFVDQTTGSVSNQPDPFGQGAIVVTGNGQFKTSSWARHFTTDFIVSNFTGSAAIYVNGIAYWDGTIYANSDFGIYSSWTTLNCNNISAHGKTATIQCDGPIELTGSIDANISKTGGQTCTISRGTVNPDNVLTVEAGTLTLASTAAWQGTNVVVKTVDAKQQARLKLAAGSSLTSDANVALTSGGKLIIPSGVCARVATLTKDGTSIPEGIYRSATLGDCMEDAGRLTIGHPGCVLIFR